MVAPYVRYVVSTTALNRLPPLHVITRRFRINGGGVLINGGPEVFLKPIDNLTVY